MKGAPKDGAPPHHSALSEQPWLFSQKLEEGLTTPAPGGALVEDMGASVERAARHLRRREQNGKELGRVNPTGRAITQRWAAKDLGKYVFLGTENDPPEWIGLSRQGERKRLAVADPSYEEACRRVTGHCCWQSLLLWQQDWMQSCGLGRNGKSQPGQGALRARPGRGLGAAPITCS